MRQEHPRNVTYLVLRVMALALCHCEEVCRRGNPGEAGSDVQWHVVVASKLDRPHREDATDAPTAAVTLIRPPGVHVATESMKFRVLRLGSWRQSLSRLLC